MLLLLGVIIGVLAFLMEVAPIALKRLRAKFL